MPGFESDLILSAGENEIVVTAKDEAGNAGSDSITVTNSGGADPRTVSGLRLWLRAIDLNLSDGDRVGAWPNSAGGTLRAAQHDPNLQPTFKSGVVNGKPVVRFEGAQILDTAEAAWSEYTVMFVARSTGGTFPQLVVAADTDADHADRVFANFLWDSTRYRPQTFNDGSDAPNEGDAAVTTTDWNVLGVSRAASTVEVRANGARSNASAGTPIETNQQMRVGARRDDYEPFITDFLTGDIAEILVFDRALTSSEMDTIDAYLSEEYGITVIAPEPAPDGTTRYVEVTIPAANIGSTLTNFPVYLDLSLMPTEFWSSVQADGGDLRVTEGALNTRCPTDLVGIDTTAQEGELHFKASSVNASSDTTFRIYYDAASTLAQPDATDAYGRNAVWSDYELVTHDGGGVDATGNHAFTPAGVTPGSASGEIGDATSYGGGTNHSVTTSTVPIGGGAHTWQAWVTVDAGVDGLDRFWSNGLGDVYYNDADAVSSGLTWGVEGRVFRHSANNAVTVGTPSLWHGTFDGGEGGEGMNIYVDGALANGGTGSGADSLTDGALVLANRADLARGLTGTIDEFRIRLSELPADWIAAEHANQNDPNAFYLIGSEESA